MKRRFAVPIVACVALAVPAGASAHARTATVALDYRLILDHASTTLPGVSVRILDGDRDFHVIVHRGTLVIRGDLGEPMLRIGPQGTWVNRASLTAVAEKLTQPSHGWKRLSRSSSYTWHEHRLSPPPYSSSHFGPVARFIVPATLDGRRVSLAGTFVRVQRPKLWPWLAATIAAAAVVVALVWRRPRIRARAATVLGALAGLAAVTTLVVFDAADAPNGKVAWAQIALGIALAAVVFAALVRLHGVRRAHLAGLLGGAAAAVSIGSAGVFLHGHVISLLSPSASRALCAAALVAGATAAGTSLVTEDA